MVRHSNEFFMAWSSLQVGHSDVGWQAIPIASTPPFELRAGRRAPDNAEAVLIGFSSVSLSKGWKFPEGKGFAVERVELDDDKLWLALTRKPEGSEELFSSMASDVIGALDDAAIAGRDERGLLALFLGRVGGWQEFMKRGSQLLAPEAEIGLVGELFVLRSLLDNGLPCSIALDAWRGPLDALQDFELGTGALEVKSTLSTSGFPARIGSLSQLDDSIRQPLYLGGVRLAQRHEGRTLSDLIDEVRCVVKGDVQSEILLAERILSAGFFDQHAEKYARKFVLVELRLFEVTDDFPRLTLGRVPNGVTNATYDIDLDKVVGQTVELKDALNKLGVMTI